MNRAWIVIVTLVLILLSPENMDAQEGYRADSLQFKMYTRLYVGTESGLDSIVVKRVFCDFCSRVQLEMLKREAYRQSLFESRNPKYQSPGEHRLALYVRLSKKDFKALNDNQ